MVINQVCAMHNPSQDLGGKLWIVRQIYGLFRINYKCHTISLEIFCPKLITSQYIQKALLVK
jgi:hypothetical protein